MDLLYSRYTNPMELMGIYMNQGRFGEFVTEVLNAESERKKEEFEKKQDWMLWIAYLLGMHEESFKEWKAGLLNPNNQNKEVRSDASLSQEDIQNIIQTTFNRVST